MSDAIRCEACRWWESEGDESDFGHCHLNPPVYTGGAPLEPTNWYQPVTHFKDYCSRGEPKTEDQP